MKVTTCSKSQLKICTCHVRAAGGVCMFVNIYLCAICTQPQSEDGEGNNLATHLSYHGRLAFSLYVKVDQPLTYGLYMLYIKHK